MHNCPLDYLCAFAKDLLLTAGQSFLRVELGNFLLASLQIINTDLDPVF